MGTGEREEIERGERERERSRDRAIERLRERERERERGERGEEREKRRVEEEHLLLCGYALLWEYIYVLFIYLLQITHKHYERRLLVAESCGVLAPYIPVCHV